MIWWTSKGRKMELWLMWVVAGFVLFRYASVLIPLVAYVFAPAWKALKVMRR